MGRGRSFHGGGKEPATFDLPNFNGILEQIQKIPSGTLVTAGGAGLIAFLAGLAVARGVVRQIIGMINLGAGISAALYVFQHRSVVLGVTGASLSTDKLLMVAAGAGLLAYFVSKMFMNLLAGLGVLSLLSSFTGWKGGLISLLPSGFLIWAGALLLRLIGNVYGVENAALVQKEGAKVTETLTAWVHQLSQKVDRSTFGAMIEKLDPYDVRATANLSRLLILWPDGRAWQQIASKGPQTAAMLNHPALVALGRDPKVRQAIDLQDFAGLMQLPQVEKAAANPELQPFLTGLALEEAMDTIVYKQPPPAPAAPPPRPAGGVPPRMR